MIHRAGDSQIAPAQPNRADGGTRTTRRSGDFRALFRAVSDEGASDGRRLAASRNPAGQPLRRVAVPGPQETTTPPPAELARVRFRGRVGRGDSLPPAAPAPGQPAASFGGFVSTSDPRAPHLVRFAEVPDGAKHPLGPYRQAPPEFGGDWWQVNPFTGSEPWRRLDAKPAAEAFPEGFVEVFGPRPKSSDFATNREYQVARVRWEQDLKYFRGTGVPDGTDPARLEEATQAYEEWGLGRPVFFQDRYGWRVRFPDSEIPAFGGSPKTAVQAPHILIAHYQIQLIRHGVTPARLHPWLPTQLAEQASPISEG